MNVKQKENAVLSNILVNLKELRRRGDLSKVKAKREEYLRLLKHEEPSSLRKLNMIVNKLTERIPNASIVVDTDSRRTNSSTLCVCESQCEENRKAQEIQYDHVDIDNSFVRCMSHDASNATRELWHGHVNVQWL
jgi:hypothetical protein